MPFRELRPTGELQTPSTQTGGFRVLSPGTPEAPEQPGFIKSVAQDVTRPFLRTGLTGYGVARGGFNIAQAAIKNIMGRDIGGDIEEAGRALSTEPRDFGFFGDISPITTPKQAVGAGLQIGSTFIGGGSVRGATTTAFRETLKRGALVGAKEGAIAGGLYGAGRGLEQDKTAGQIATQSLTEAVFGLPFGALSGAASSLLGFGARRIGEKISPQLKARRIAELEKGVAQEYSKALNLNKTQRKLQERSERDVASFLAREGVVLDVEGGKLKPGKAIEILQDKADAENTLFRRILQDDGGYVDLNVIRRNVLSLVDEVGVARDQAIARINKEFDAYIRQNSRQLVKGASGSLLVPKAIANDLKINNWSKSRFTSLSPQSEKTVAGAHRLIGNAFKRAIEDSTSDINIRQFNQRLGDLSETIFLLGQREGMPVIGGRLGKYFSRTIGAIVGAQGGPITSIAGAIGGDKLADILQNPTTKTWYARALLDKLRKSGRQEIIDQAYAVLRKRAAERATRPLLPGRAGPSRTVIKLPASRSKLRDFVGRSGLD